jgi:cobalamin biosynthesis Mg chelatase CobN
MKEASTQPTTATVSTSSGTSWQSIAALILAGLAVVLSVLAVWLGRPRFGRDPDQAGPETSSGAAK